MSNSLKNPLKLIDQFWSHTTSRIVFLSILVGVVAGLGAVGFNFLLDSASDIMMVQGFGYETPLPGGEGETQLPSAPTRRWLILFIPAIGGLLSGCLVFWIAPEAEGHGTDAMIESFHHKRGIIRKRIPIVKTIASALTIGSGGSAGREGPIAQVGAGFGSALATWLKTSDRERRLLMVAGAGAGIGAIFRAPLGGALFTTEVLYRDVEFEAPALVPTFVASITAYSIYCGLTGRWGSIFEIPRLQFTHPMELPLYAVLGVFCAVAGIVYVRTLHWVRDRCFHPLRVPQALKPAMGGILVGCIGFFLPEVLSMGYGWVQLAMNGELPLQLIVTIFLVKILATALTISSGGSGGLFAPSMVIGGLLGSTLGSILYTWVPNIVTQPASFALVGMAGFFSGVAKAPISSLIMVSEMTGGYGLLVPLMLTTAATYLLIPKHISIYDNQVNGRVDSPSHEGEFVADVLERIPVRDALVNDSQLTVFQQDTPLTDMLDAVAISKQHSFPVLNKEGLLKGVIYIDDIRIFFSERNLPSASVVAQDLIAPSLTTVTPDEDLASALRKFRLIKYHELPVVESSKSLRVIGVLSRRDVISKYHDRMYAKPQT